MPFDIAVVTYKGKKHIISNKKESDHFTEVVRAYANQHVCNTQDGEVCSVCGRTGNGEG